MNETLMLPAPTASPPGQTLLFSPDIEVRLEEEESRGIYTAERALAKRPGLKDAVIALRAQGEGYLSIAKKLNCHHRTASTIAGKFPEEIDIERAKRVNRLRSAADKLVELIDSNPESVPPNMRALAASQLYDKGELLDGRATQRVERTERIDIYAQWDEVMEKVLEPSAVLEVDPQIGLEGGNVSAIAAPASQADRADIDAESTDSDPVAQEPASTDTALPTTDQPNETAPASPAARTEGGRGSAAEGRGGLAQSGSKERNFSGNGSLRPPPI